MKFTIFQESRIGCRKNNQDRTAYGFTRDCLLMVLADGMGGHLHGEIAAHIAVQYISQAFQREAHTKLRDPVIFLSRAVNRAHDTILDFSFEKKLEQAPRTTIVACVVQDGYVWWAHAGDSRLYLLRRDKVAAQTRDHSRVQFMLDNGMIAEEDVANHPGRNRVYSCLGGTRPPQIEFSKRHTLRDGDTIVLASDGFWGSLTEEQLLQGMSAAPDTDILVSTPPLLDMAEEAGGRTCDNLSVVVMRWLEDNGLGGFDAISTEAMSVDDYSSRISSFERSRQNDNHLQLTDEEIEKTIAEINDAIHRIGK